MAEYLVGTLVQIIPGPMGYGLLLRVVDSDTKTFDTTDLGTTLPEHFCEKFIGCEAIFRFNEENQVWDIETE